MDGGYYYYPTFPDAETAAQRGKVDHSVAHNLEAAEPRFEPRQPHSVPLNH